MMMEVARAHTHARTHTHTRTRTHTHTRTRTIPILSRSLSSFLTPVRIIRSASRTIDSVAQYNLGDASLWLDLCLQNVTKMKLRSSVLKGRGRPGNIFGARTSTSIISMFSSLRLEWCTRLELRPKYRTQLMPLVAFLQTYYCIV